MSVSSEVQVAPPTLAELEAGENLCANLSTGHFDGTGVSVTLPADVTWLYGRDGSLTAKDARGRWLAGCSVPRLAAQTVLARLDVVGTVACFLVPTHAEQVRHVLDRLTSRRALILVQPDLLELIRLLCCGDFSEALRSSRLFVVTGPDWAARLDRVFDDHPGLPVPTRFVRLPSSDETQMGDLISSGQRVFSTVMVRRAEQVEHARSDYRPSDSRAGRVCVLAPSWFSLWDDAGAVLASSLESDAKAVGVEVVRVDPDVPARSSPLELLRVAATCDVVVAAGIGRSDVPGVLPINLPLVTWVVSPRLPEFQHAGPRDGLIVVDEALRGRAREAGWPASRVRVRAWPTRAERGPALGQVGVLVDTTQTEAPERIRGYSSHIMLWNSIREELGKDPAALGADPLQFLQSRLKQYGVSSQGLDERMFIDELIVPAYHQGWVRALSSAGLGVRVFGKGWNAFPEFSSKCGGVIVGRDTDQSPSQTPTEESARVGATNPITLEHAAEACGVLLDVFPWMTSHPVCFLGVPVVSTGEKSVAAVVRQVRQGGAVHACGETPVGLGAVNAILLSSSRAI